MASAAFHVARRRHDSVLGWIARNDAPRQWGPGCEEEAASNERNAAAVWDAIVGAESAPPADSPAECASDTMPEQHRALLVENEPAAAVAWSLLELVYVSQEITPLARRDLARAAWERFEEQASTVEKMALGFGWSLGDSWQVWRDIGQAGNTADVTRIAELAGRFVVALKGAVASRVAGAMGDLHSVEQGADLSRVLPSERMLMADPVTEPMFADRLESRRLMQYSVRGRAPAGRGPIVMAIDESGSMHGRRNDWAKAATLAVAQVAKAGKRPVSVVHFATGCVEHELDPSNVEQVLRTIRSFLNGGTSIGLALERALEQVKALAKKGDTGADIILATDGIDGSESRIVAAVEALRAYGARLWLVAIECRIHEGHPLRAGAETYIELGVESLTDPTSMVSLKGAL